MNTEPNNVVTLEQTAQAEKLIAAMNLLNELAENRIWFQSQPYRELSPRDAYHEGMAYSTAKAAASAIFGFLLHARYTDSLGPFARYALRQDEDRNREPAPTVIN